MKDISEFFFMVTLSISVIVTIFVLGNNVGYERGKDDARKTAVEQGHAEYYLDDNHNRQWRWKDCK